MDKRIKEEQARVLANYIRSDKLHEAKNDVNSNLYKILLGLAVGWVDFRETVNQVVDNYNIYNSVELLEEWEQAVGIPDDIFFVAKDIETRRKNILLKIAGSRAETALQFENVAKILGFDVRCESAYQYCRFPLRFPIIFTNQSNMPFLMIITIDEKYKPATFPFKFPIKFKGDSALILKLFFDKIKPANTKLIFRYV